MTTNKYMRTLLATLIWLFDIVLKFAIGFLIVFLVWLPFGLLAGASFSFGWLIATCSGMRITERMFPFLQKQP